MMTMQAIAQVLAGALSLRRVRRKIIPSSQRAGRDTSRRLSWHQHKEASSRHAPALPCHDTLMPLWPRSGHVILVNPIQSPSGSPTLSLCSVASIQEAAVVAQD